VLVSMSLTLPGCLETLGETVLGLPADAIREACVGGHDVLVDGAGVGEHRLRRQPHRESRRSLS
jgi:hypothetical protein